MPMGTVSDLGGLTMAEALDPPYRHVKYEDEPAVATMSWLLRLCWCLQPPEPNEIEDSTHETSSTHQDYLPAKDVYKFVGPLSRMSEEERSSLPRNPHKDDWQSDWRRQIAYCWRHVFSDVSEFLYAVNPSVGMWTHRTTEEEMARYGPHMDSFAVFYSDASPTLGEKAMIKSWPATNVIIVPMFVDTGVKISFDRTDPGDAVAHLHTWNDDMKCHEALYLKQGVEVAITVEIEDASSSPLEEREDDGRKGVAAVFTFAALVRDDGSGFGLSSQDEE